MELSDYVFKKKEELESSVEGASNIKTLEKIAFQLFLPFTKLDRIILASNFATRVNWEGKKFLSGIVLGKYALYTIAAYKLIN